MCIARIHTLDLLLFSPCGTISLSPSQLHRRQLSIIFFWRKPKTIQRYMKPCLFMLCSPCLTTPILGLLFKPAVSMWNGFAFLHIPKSSCPLSSGVDVRNMYNPSHPLISYRFPFALQRQLPSQQHHQHHALLCSGSLSWFCAPSWWCLTTGRPVLAAGFFPSDI